MTPYDKATELYRQARADRRPSDNTVVAIGSVPDITRSVRKAARLIGRERGFEWLRVRLERDGDLVKSRIEYMLEEKRESRLYAEELLANNRNMSFQSVKEVISLAETAIGFCEALEEWKTTPQYHDGSPN